MTLVDRPPTPGPPVRTAAARPLPLLLSTAALSAGALAVGARAAHLPVGPGNNAVHLGYPFFAVAVAVVLTAVSRRSREAVPRWSALVAAIGLAYAVNALLIAVLSYAVTPEGAALPVRWFGWLADVFFPVCDAGLLGLMVGLLPDCRPVGRHRLAVGAVLVLTVLTMLGEALVPHTLDSTEVANPVAIDLLRPLSGGFQVLIPLMFLSVVALSVVRGVQLARRSRRNGTRVASSALGSGLVLLLTFVGQAVVPESSWYAAGSIVLTGAAAASLLALRVATAETSAARRSPRPAEPARTGSGAA